MRGLRGKALEFIGECWHGKFAEASIERFLSKNCLHQKTIGKGVGIEGFTTDCYDWSRAFPDYSTKVVAVEEYKNLVICDVARRGTHLYPYRSTNSDQKSILTKSCFLQWIENVEPTGISYSEPAKVIFSFDRGKISQLSIEEDPEGLSRQLGFQKTGQIKPDLLHNKKIVMEALQERLRAALSLREAESLALIFCGFSAKHAAEILRISYRTVETFLHHAYQKLHCYGKQDALEMMYEKELLTLWMDLGKLILEKK